MLRRCCIDYLRGSRWVLCKVGVLSELSVSGSFDLVVLRELSACLEFLPVNGVQGRRNDFVD